MAIYLEAAHWVEVNLTLPTGEQIHIPSNGQGRPQTQVPFIIADKAYDIDPLRFRIHCRGMELIYKSRKNRVQPSLHEKR